MSSDAPAGEYPPWGGYRYPWMNPQNTQYFEDNSGPRHKSLLHQMAYELYVQNWRDTGTADPRLADRCYVAAQKFFNHTNHERTMKEMVEDG